VQLDAFADLKVGRDVPSGTIDDPAPSMTNSTGLSQPAPTSTAKEARMALNRAVLTASARNPMTAPVVGLTQP
jgi:hypothetical protein